MSETEKIIKENGYDYIKPIDERYGVVYVIPSKRTMICELTQAYVPIEKFQDIFVKMSDLVREHSIKRFVFDKQQLRAFNQPSMEWYFVVWKKEMFEIGLDVHRKILPQGEEWFADAVAAGRAHIMKKHPDCVVTKLDMKYVDTIVDGIEK